MDEHGRPLHDERLHDEAAHQVVARTTRPMAPGRCSPVWRPPGTPADQALAAALLILIPADFAIDEPAGTLTCPAGLTVAHTYHLGVLAPQYGIRCAPAAATDCVGAPPGPSVPIINAELALEALPTAPRGPAQTTSYGPERHEPDVRHLVR